MSRRLKVLMSAYACEPHRGSEPEVGWQWAIHMAQQHDVTVITRANNRAGIEAELARRPRPHPHFVYYDLPRWQRFWKRGNRGVQLYYSLWQRGMLRVARALHAQQRFELTHHVTFGKFAVPSPLVQLPIPLVAGPVGGGESTPPGFQATYSWPGRITEILRSSARRWSLLNPFSRRRLAATHTFIAATPQTAEWLAPLSKRAVLVEPQCGMTEPELNSFAEFPIRRDKPFRLISIARLVHWKGLHLALAAFAQFAKHNPESEYWIVSGGPELERLKQLAAALGVAKQVTFWGRLPQLKDVYQKLAVADVFVHPALHEGFGYACLEALAAGRPVLCLDWGGPGMQVTPECGYAVTVSHPKQVIDALSAAMQQLGEDEAKRVEMAHAARRRAATFSWQRKAAFMNGVYRSVVASRSEGGGSPD